MTILCLSPIKIRNPNFGRKPKAGTILSLKDCSNSFLTIPCGHCPECIANKQMQLVQRIQMESLSHHLFFCTLTYQNSTLPILTTSSGYSIRYADIHDLQCMFKRIRKDNLFGRPFKYFAVSERGSEKGRPHFHIIFMVDKSPKDSFGDILSLEKIIFDVVLSQWKRNIGSSRKPIYLPLCEYHSKYVRGILKRNYDLHYILPSNGDSCSSVSFYVLKYILKDSQRDVNLQRALKLNLPLEEYYEVYSKVKSRYVASKDFGDSKNPEVRKYLKECISRSKHSESDKQYAKFYNYDTGQSFPLSRFYKSKPDIYSFKDAIDFYYNSNKDSIDSPFFNDKYITQENYSVIDSRLAKFDKQLELSQLDCEMDLIDEIE